MSAAPVIELEAVRQRIARIESMGSRALPPKLKIELERLRTRQNELEGLVTADASESEVAAPQPEEAIAPAAAASGVQLEAPAPAAIGQVPERPTLTLVTIDGTAVVPPADAPISVEADADLGAARVLAHQVQGQARADYEIFVTRLDHFMSVRIRLEGAAMRSKSAIEEHVLWAEHLRAARAAFDGLRDLERHEEAALLFAAFGDDRQQALALLRSLEGELQAIEVEALPAVVVEAGPDRVLVGPGFTAARGFEVQVIGCYPDRWYPDLVFEVADAAPVEAPALTSDLSIGLLRTKDVAADVSELRERLNYVARSVPSVEVLQGLSIEVRENLTFEYDFVVKGQQHIVVVAFFRTGGRDWIYDPEIDGFRCAEQQIEGFTSDALSMLGVLVTSHGAKLEGPRKRIFMTAFFGGGSVDVSAFKSEVDVEFVWARCKPSGVPVVRGKIEPAESAFERLIRQPT
jgi:hypothetical protein